MTNPDNVGGLPELPRGILWRTDAQGWQSIDYSLFPSIGPVRYAYSEDQMRAYGELCRAAPAGGDVPCDMGEMCLGCTPRNADGSCPDAAPAGSGEVEEMAQRLEERAKWFRDGNDDATLLRTAAALLRKLQQGAE